MFETKWVAFLSWRPFLQFLFIVNFLGTWYGYYWYKNQLAVTPVYWWPFVPDSPTASLFFSVVILLYLMRLQSGLLEAFAAVSLFKYGIWAVAAIFSGAWLETGACSEMLQAIPAANWMLVFSHSGMAIEALLFRPLYSYTYRDLLIVSMWTLTNDFLDYVFLLHPWVDPALAELRPLLGSFTLMLSLVSLAIFATHLARKRTTQGDFR